MYSYNSDFNKWYSYKEELTLDDYNFYKQELQSVRFYSKCLSGATYYPVTNTNDLYDILGEYELRNWYISAGVNASPYSSTLIPPQFASAITATSSYDFYTKYLGEYGLTLKNHFTPARIIKESAKNFYQVDVATTGQLDLTQPITVLDDVKLITGHKVLVKNQKSSVVLLNTDDPNNFISGNYEIIEEFGATIEYSYFDQTNGIYEFNGTTLTKLNILDDYQNCVRLSYYVKLGTINKDKQFHLSRLRNGYFPTSSKDEPMEFTEKKNWILRNRVDYNNLFETNYYDVMKFATQSYFLDGVTYSIPTRTIAIGEFGIILNTQNGVSNIINNKYKVNLRSISQTEKYYWICGDDGILLKIRKHDFLIQRIEADCNCPRNLITTDLYSISFFNDLKGVVVGQLNTVLVTNNGGTTWKRLRIPDFDAFTFTSVIYHSLNSFYLAGYNGVFIEFIEDITGWNAVRRRISRFIDDDDEYVLVDNINQIFKTTINTWGLSYSFSTQSTDTTKELLFLVADDSKIVAFDINNSISKFDFLYLDFPSSYGDIKTITRKKDSNIFYFKGTDTVLSQENIYSFDINNHNYIGVGNSFSNTILGTTPSLESQNISPNKIIDYQGLEMFICGNNSLLLSSTYSTLDFEVLDPKFESKLKSKMLFLDYDIGSKLVFFTDFGEYRLPTSLTFSSLSFSATSSLVFSSLVYGATAPSFMTQSENNWWSYWQDSNKTFEYYSTFSAIDESTKVLISSTFSYSSLTSSYVISSLSISTNSIANLAPTFINPTGSIPLTSGSSVGISSRYNGFNLTPIVAPTQSYDLYLYDYLMIARFSSGSYDVGVGDLIHFESAIVDSKLLVNKKLTFSGFDYVYMFNDFNGQMINDLSATTYSITLTNLNKYSNVSDLVSRFDLHPISKGYKLEIFTSSNVFNISAQFNNFTAYYNLASNVVVNGEYKTMSYTSGFLNFGYTPTYNLLDYLENLNDKTSLNPTFYGDKQVYSMPHYLNIPLQGLGNFTSDKCYVDYNGITYSNITGNTILFGAGRKLEWDSLLINTFVDVNIYHTSTPGINPQRTERLLIINKYANFVEGFYTIEFHKNLNFVLNSPVFFIDILSRRKISQISYDLQELNLIQRAKLNKKEIFLGSEYSNYDRQINFKINTDSYAKYLLSDTDFIKNTTALIYTDYKNELSMNITSLGKDYQVPILNTASFSNKLFISCSQKHELLDGEGVVLEWTGGTGSSQEINQQYFGYYPVNIISDYNFTINIPYGNVPSVGNDSGFVRYSRKDPFFNYQPIDVIDLGIDRRGKQSVELKVENVLLSDNKYKLINVDFEKYRFRLIDGLTLEILSQRYPWILEAEISDAVIGQDGNGIVWYNGTWECGRWFGGTWISGAWMSGDWYNGLWRSLTINDNKLTVDIDEKSTNILSSTWFSGRWYGGTWENGLWVDGRWYGGTWTDGLWYKGVWNDGTWLNGTFTGGLWIIGLWNNGVFNCDNNPSYWLDGKWFGGDFENGMWYNGLFDQKDLSGRRLAKKSRFGTKAYNSRTATWHGGKWVNGSFFSNININDDGDVDVSDVHKYSIWYTGKWSNGNWYGGIAYNMDFKSGTWHGGILDDIQIIGMNSSENYFILNGIFKFNIGDEFTVVDNRLGASLGSTYGTNFNPKKYTVLYTIEDSSNKWTHVYVATNITDDVTAPTYTGLWVVSRFRNLNWKSGIWTNGIYESGRWEGGIWYNGNFEQRAIWM